MEEHIILLPTGYQGFIDSESKCLNYLQNLRFPTTLVICPRCNRFLKKVIKIYQDRKEHPAGDNLPKTNRYWCQRCHNFFYDFSDTLLGSNKLPWSKVICGVNLFALGKTARQAARILKINYKSAHTLFHKIRLAIKEQHRFRKSRIMIDRKKEAAYSKQYFSKYIKGKLEAYRHISLHNKKLYLIEQQFRYEQGKSQAITGDLLGYLVAPRLKFPAWKDTKPV